MGERVNPMKLMLYVEVRAFESQKGTAECDENVAFASTHRVQKGRVEKR
jgi:hypothetical protein